MLLERFREMLKSPDLASDPLFENGRDFLVEFPKLLDGHCLEVFVVHCRPPDISTTRIRVHQGNLQRQLKDGSSSAFPQRNAMIRVKAANATARMSRAPSAASIGTLIV